jgi:hypothetical protein
MKFPTSLIPGISVMLVAVSGAVYADPTPEPVAPIKYEGRDRRDPRFVCKLEISEVGFVGDEVSHQNLKAIVKTNYAHDGAQAPALEVKYQGPSSDGRFSLFKGEDEQGNVVRLVLPPAVTDFLTVDQYAVRWLHGDHFHTNTCIQLKLAP